MSAQRGPFPHPRNQMVGSINFASECNLPRPSGGEEIVIELGWLCQAKSELSKSAEQLPMRT